MNNLKPIEKAYWLSYLASQAEEAQPKQALVTSGYAGTPAITDELLALYLAGKKYAGSSVVEDYAAAGEALPAVGNFWILLDAEAKPGCILRTERVLIHKFMDVPAEIAIAEGEGDLSLAYWRKVHGELWRPCLTAWGLAAMEEASVITEFFSIVYRGDQAPLPS